MSKTVPATRKIPKRAVPLADLTVLVRVPGSPWLNTAFTADELASAQGFAAKHGGIVDDISGGHDDPDACSGPSGELSCSTQ